MIGDKTRHWREDLGDLHVSILQILARQPARKSLHYSRITQKMNYEAGLFAKPVEMQFRQDTINRRIVELRRRGFVQMTDRGKNRITDEGIAYLEAIKKMPPPLPPKLYNDEFETTEKGEGLEIKTRPEGEKATNISKSKRKKKVRDIPAPQKTFEFFMHGTVTGMG